MDGNQAYIISGANLTISKITSIQYDPFELHPDTLNHVIMLVGDIGGDNILTAYTLISYIDVVPRWALA